MGENLKPCPFCGGSVHAWELDSNGSAEWYVECEKCGVNVFEPEAAEGGKMPVEEWWNHRV